MVLINIMSSKQKIEQQQTAPKVRTNITNGGKENWYLKKKDSKKRDLWKELKRNNRKMKPQIGVADYNELLKSFTDLVGFAEMDISEDGIRFVEGIIALYINVKDSATYNHFMSGVFLYVRDMCDKSMTTQVLTYLQEVFDSDIMTTQSSDEVSKPNWLTCLRDMQTNWALAKNNRAFKQFSKLLGILVTLGLCQASDLQFSIHGFKLFDESLLNKHMTAFDLADALFGTVAYFAEGAYLCFQTGSLQPLLLNDFSILELDSEYTNIITWWSLVKNGNLERVMNISDAEFNSRLNALTNKLCALSSSLTGLDKKLVCDKITKCKDIQNNLVTHKISSGTRRAPFAVELYGESSQGKTTFGDQLIDALLTSAQLPTDKKYRAALNPGDKFFSNWTSDKLVAILDDMANEKSNFVEKPPTRAIIDICNNQMYYAPKAELEAKGKCFVEPEVVLVTTNVKHLSAGQYSDCPYSIQRRMDLVMTVECKPEFQRVVDGRTCGVDSAKIREHYTKDGKYTPPAIDDIWFITIEQAVRPEQMHVVGTYAPLVWNNTKMEKVPAHVAIQCAIEYFHTHRNNQQALMDSMLLRAKTLEVCPHEGCIHIKGFCPHHSDVEEKLEKQIGLTTALALSSVYNRVSKKVRGDSTTFIGKCENMATKALYKHTNKFLKKWDWICLFPSDWLENEKLTQVLCWFYKDELDTAFTDMTYTTFGLCSIFAFIDVTFAMWSFVILFIFGAIYCRSRSKEALITALKKRNNSLPEIIRNTRDKYARGVCKLSILIATLYVISRVYLSWRSLNTTQVGEVKDEKMDTKVLVTQSVTKTEEEPVVAANTKSATSLKATTQKEIDARDAKVDVWAKLTTRSLPSQQASDTTTVDRLKNTVAKNILHARIQVCDDENPKGSGKVYMTNILMIDSNLMIIPGHYFDLGDELFLTCHKENAEAVGGKFRTRISINSSVLIDGKDMRICYTTTGGSYKNLLKFFPVGELVDHPFQMMWRHRSGDMMHATGRGVYGETTNGEIKFKGLLYKNLSVNTFNGMCGAILISDTKSPVITGIHVAGIEGHCVGSSCIATVKEIESAIKRVRNMQGVLKTGSGEHFQKQVLDKDILTNEVTHDKSPMNYLPVGSQFNYHGTCSGQTTSRSDVRQTPISEVVTEVTGVENIWGPPKMRPEWFGWQTALANASDPATPVSHDLLSKSIEDYKAPLIELAKLDVWQSQPLNDKDNLCGRAGVKFIDAINLATSIGYPLTGAKRKHIVELEPTEAHPNNYEFNQEIKDEIDRVHDCYKRGERAFTVAKACKKDEVLPVAKGKCRIFYGNSLPLTFLVRKYFLPVLRLVQMNPLVSECAVGINCHGPEWNELYEHIMQHGKQSMFGGDYGKYDQKMPSQLLLASIRVLIDIAQAMGYDQKDLDIMEAMAGDIVYSLIAVNGDLIGLQEGTHISGNSLTVVLNGIGGSLNLRNYFYSNYSNTIPFRKAAAMVTYGDDNIGTVSERYPNFNIKGCSEFLAKYGQVYTMPDKESELKPYLDADEFEFLKRVNVYHPKLGISVGALLDKSIFKSLHCYLRPKKAPLTPNEACAQNIDTALREWFNHGESVYEKRRTQMQTIAERSGITHMCTLLQDTYDDRVNDWKLKYDADYIARIALNKSE